MKKVILAEIIKFALLLYLGPLTIAVVLYIAFGINYYVSGILSGLVLAWAVGYKGEQRLSMIQGIEKVFKSPYSRGLAIGIGSMVIDTLFNLIVFKDFAFGRAVLLTTICAVGARRYSIVNSQKTLS